MKKWTKGFKRVMAVTLAALIVSDTIDLSALTVVAADEKPEVTITAFDELDAAVAEQKLPVGATEEDIVFPDTLGVTVIKQDSGDTVSANAVQTENGADTGTAGEDGQALTLEDITWQLDAAESDAPVFDAGEASDGFCYVYIMKYYGRLV